MTFVTISVKKPKKKRKPTAFYNIIPRINLGTRIKQETDAYTTSQIFLRSSQYLGVVLLNIEANQDRKHYNYELVSLHNLSRRLIRNVNVNKMKKIHKLILPLRSIHVKWMNWKTTELAVSDSKIILAIGYYHDLVELFRLALPKTLVNCPLL